MNQTIAISTRQLISLIKGLAIFSVICAHCNAISVNAGQLEVISSYALNNLGSIGVICFFVISGFLFHCESKKSFFKKKIFVLGIPWAFGVTIVYLYVALRKSQISISDFLRFAVGKESYFYYLTMLVLLYVTFAFVPYLKRTVPLVVFVMIGVISGGFFSQSNPLAPTPYLNYFNWVGYFAFGMLIRIHLSKFSKLFKKLYRYRWGCYAVYLLILVYQCAFLQGGWYFGIPRMLFSWCGAVSLVFFARDIQGIQSVFPKRILADAGEASLFVYIWHMPIAGIVANVFSRQPLGALMLLRPFIVLTIVLSACYFVSFLLRKMKCKKIGMVVGLKS